MNRYILFPCLLCLLSCAPDTPRDILVGHWKVKSTYARLDNPDSEGGEADVTPADIYFSRDFFWRHEPGSDPFKLYYKIVKEDPENNSLIICVENTGGEKVFSTVKFSADYNEMRVITKKDPLQGFPPEIADSLRGAIDSLILETLCIRVDNATSPFRTDKWND
jgi:hypothetical protein